jgi:hypothetical protein
MNRISWLGGLVIVAVYIGTVGPVLAIGQAATRTIWYDRDVAIAGRLLPGDVDVVVKRLESKPFDGPPPVPETFAEEMRRVSAYETIAILKISDTQGQLIDGGTWVRTRLQAHATEFARRGSLVDSAGFVEFSQDGGRLQLGSVAVTVGTFAEFVAQQDYLVFLRTSGGRTYAALAFRVDSNRILQPVKRNDGTSIMAYSTLIGRSVPEVVAALAQAQ